MNARPGYHFHVHSDAVLNCAQCERESRQYAERLHVAQKHDCEADACSQCDDIVEERLMYREDFVARSWREGGAFVRNEPPDRQFSDFIQVKVDA